MRVLSICLFLVVGLLLLAPMGQSDTIPDTIFVTYSTPEENTRYAQLHSVTFLEETTSVPFDGDTTPSGIIIFTSPTNPPAGFEAGELYLFVDDIRGWELK